jgi:hypothetical protein
MPAKRGVHPPKGPVGVIIFPWLSGLARFVSSKATTTILHFTIHSSPMKNVDSTAKLSLQKKIVTRFSSAQSSTKPLPTSLETWTSFC